MGKTEKGAVWLNENLFSSYDYWQFWRNTDDRDVKRFLNFFTELKTDEIDNMCKKESNINNLKIILANEATKILHGEIASKRAYATAKETFIDGGLGDDLPEIKVNSNKVRNGLKLIEFLSSNKIFSSKSEARRAIENKGLKINNLTVNDPKKIIGLEDFKDKALKISFGKKKHYLIKVI